MTTFFHSLFIVFVVGEELVKGLNTVSTFITVVVIEFIATHCLESVWRRELTPEFQMIWFGME